MTTLLYQKKGTNDEFLQSAETISRYIAFPGAQFERASKEVVSNREHDMADISKLPQ